MRDLVGVLDREKAAIGVLISMQEPTQPMRAEAASAGFYESPALHGSRVPRLQLLTIAELLDGRRIELPPRHDETLKAAPKVKRKKTHRHETLEFGPEVGREDDTPF